MIFFNLRNSIFMVSIFAFGTVGIVSNSSAVNDGRKVIFCKTVEELDANTIEEFKQKNQPDSDVTHRTYTRDNTSIIVSLSKGDTDLRAVDFFEGVRKKCEENGVSRPESIPEYLGVVEEKCNSSLVVTAPPEGFRPLSEIRNNDTEGFSYDDAQDMLRHMVDDISEIHNTFGFTIGERGLKDVNVYVDIEKREFQFSDFEDSRQLPKDMEKQENESAHDMIETIYKEEKSWNPERDYGITKETHPYGASEDYKGFVNIIYNVYALVLSKK